MTQLAAHYKTLWCPEYAREYLLKKGMNYTYDDLLTIAKGQMALEDRVYCGVRKSESRKTESIDSRLHDSRLPVFSSSIPICM